jgi:hypothetical protein
MYSYREAGSRAVNLVLLRATGVAGARCSGQLLGQLEANALCSKCFKQKHGVSL